MIVYYCVVIVPVAIMFLLALTNTINSNWFVHSFCFYLLITEPSLMGKD